MNPKDYIVLVIKTDAANNVLLNATVVHEGRPNWIFTTDETTRLIIGNDKSYENLFRGVRAKLIETAKEELATLRNE